MLDIEPTPEAHSGIKKEVTPHLDGCESATQ